MRRPALAWWLRPACADLVRTPPAVIGRALPRRHGAGAGQQPPDGARSARDVRAEGPPEITVGHPQLVAGAQGAGGARGPRPRPTGPSSFPAVTRAHAPTSQVTDSPAGPAPLSTSPPTEALLLASAAVVTMTPHVRADRLPTVWRKRGGATSCVRGRQPLGNSQVAARTFAYPDSRTLVIGPRRLMALGI